MTNAPREWWEDIEVCKEILFDPHHQKPFVVSEQYGRLYLLNQQGQIVISFTKAMNGFLAEKYRAENAEKDRAACIQSYNELHSDYADLQSKLTLLEKDNGRLREGLEKIRNGQFVDAADAESIAASALNFFHEDGGNG